MTLYTKSILKPIKSTDGYRICIMRNPKDYEGKYDKWMPELSPTQELRDKVKQGMKWEQFKSEFERYLQTQKESLDNIAKEASKKELTLLCVEDSPERCHRSIVAEAIKIRNPKLKVEIN